MIFLGGYQNFRGTHGKPVWCRFGCGDSAIHGHGNRVLAVERPFRYIKGCQWECRFATGASLIGVGKMASELLVHLGRTLVPCLVGSGKGIWLPQSAVSELAFPHSNSVLTALSSPSERANDSGVGFLSPHAPREHICSTLPESLLSPHAFPWWPAGMTFGCRYLLCRG